MIVPRVFGGSYIPLVLYARKNFSAESCAAGVRVVSMSSVSVCRTNGGGSTGYGCSSAARSPSVVDAGTAR
jgi:hypothetical protein